MNAAEQPDKQSTTEQPDGESWDELEQAAGDYPPSWMPDAEESHPRTLIGTVKRYNLGPDLGFGRNWICQVEDRDGQEWSVWLQRQALVNQFEEARPMPGERVAIRFRGRSDRARVAGQQPAFRYRVTVDRGPELPEFLARPRQIETDMPADTEGLPPLPPADADVPDADVFEEGGENNDDDSIPWE